MIRIIKSEFYKVRHTGILWVHLVLPIVYAVLFYLTTRFTGLRNFNAGSTIEIFLVLLGGVLPIVIGAMTAKVADMEAGAGHFQVLLASTKSRSKAYLGKWLALFIGGVFSVSLAVFIFGVLYGQQSVQAWLMETVFIAMGILAVYMIHLWIALSFGAGASLGLGFVECLFAFLFLTSIGDSVWYFLPCTWALRLPATYLLATQLPDSSYVFQEFTTWTYLAVPMTIMILICSLVWFNCWDGNSLND